MLLTAIRTQMDWLVFLMLRFCVAEDDEDDELVEEHVTKVILQQ